MSKDDENLRRIRQYMIGRAFPGLRIYMSTIGATDELGALMGKDGGKKFMQKVTDYMMGELGHPVTTTSSFDKAWKFVTG